MVLTPTHLLISITIHPCDPAVVICYLIWPCDMAVHITYLISYSSSLCYFTVIKEYFTLGVYTKLPLCVNIILCTYLCGALKALVLWE